VGLRDLPLEPIAPGPARQAADGFTAGVRAFIEPSIPSPIADTANTGGRRRSTGLAMTGETATRNSAASMTFPSWWGGC
jgi:hypothetical protein